MRVVLATVPADRISPTARDRTSRSGDNSGRLQTRSMRNPLSQKILNALRSALGLACATNRDVESGFPSHPRQLPVPSYRSLMNAAPVTASPFVHFDNDAWDDLLNYIEERRVIPIVGPELLEVETDSGPRLLYEWLAEKLAARLNVDPSILPSPLTLNDVVCQYLSQRGR
jgi:hypothetical protein